MQFLKKIVLLLLSTLLRTAFTIHTINVLYVNDDKNEVAAKSVSAALNYLTYNNNLGIQIGSFINITVRRNNVEDLSYILHAEFNNSISSKNPFHIVLDYTLRKPSSEVVKAFTAEVALPTVSTTPGQVGDISSWKNLKEDELKYLIQISPPSDIIPEIVRDIVHTQNMSNAGILFDSSFVMDHKYKSILRSVRTRHILVEIKEIESIKNRLEQFKEMDIVNYFILGQLSTTIKSVLEIAGSNNFVGRKFSWQAITQDDGLLTCNNSNISVLFMKPNYDTFGNYDHLFNIFSNYSSGISSKMDLSFYFDVTLRSILAFKLVLNSGDWKHKTSTSILKQHQEKKILNLRKYFEKVKTSFLHGKYELESNGKSFMEFNMTLERVQIQNGESLPAEILGTWRAGFNSSINVINFEEMANHSAVAVYKVVTALQEPFMMKEVDSFGNEKYSGYCIDLFEEIRKIVPVSFEYEIYTTPDNSFGFVSDSGHWNGMIRELIEKRADIALGSLTVLAERENVVDFTVAYYDLVGITIMMKTFKPTTSIFKFLRVMEVEVWLCILGTYFFTSFFIWILDKWSPYSNQNIFEFDEFSRIFSLTECLWFCLTSLTPQGGGEVPKNISGRLATATWWLFGVVIISSYTANLAAFITVSRLETPIESLDDLYKQYKIQYAPVNGSAAMTYFQRMADIEGRFRAIWNEMTLNNILNSAKNTKMAVWDYPIGNKYTKLWKAMNEAKTPNSSKDAISRVLASKSTSDGFAYLGDATEIRYQTMINCDLKMVGEEFSRKPYAIALQKGSPLKDQFNSAILQLLNERKLEKIKEQWWYLNPVNKLCKRNQEESSSISIQNIGGVFIVIFMGICLASINLIFEYSYKKHKTASVHPLPRKSMLKNHYNDKMKNILCIQHDHEDEVRRY